LSIVFREYQHIDVLISCSAQDIPIIFTPNLLRTLSGNLSKSNALLHGLAKRCMDGVANFVTAAQDPAIQVAVQLALQRHEGLDRILKDKKSKENRNNVSNIKSWFRHASAFTFVAAFLSYRFFLS
jgi:hypothetical protein